MSRPSAADLYRRYSESSAAANTREPRNARDAYQRSREAQADRLARPPRPGHTGPRQPTGPSEQEFSEYETNIKELEKELELQEKRDAEQLREFQRRYNITALDDSSVDYVDQTISQILERSQSEMAERLARLDEGLQQSFEKQMLDMETRYGEHSKTRIKTKSTDVLRVNKILREIGRGLGPDWRPVFRILVKQVPLDVVEKEVKKIERQKPFIQAYKALTVARDLNGEEFEIFRLVDALKDCDKYELAERTLDILDSEGDELFTLGTLGRPIVSGSYDVDLANGEEASNGVSNGASNGQQSDMDPAGPLADRKLLQLSKKMGERWEQLAAILQVPEEDINDIKESESDEQQTNFKLIWGWREAAMDNMGEDEAVVKLKAGFRQMGREDLAKMLED